MLSYARELIIEEGFDALLKDFLKNRNDFVHDLSRVPGWGLGSTFQTANAKRFVYHLIQQTETVMKVFSGLASAWQEQVGMPDPGLPNHAWFDDVKRSYKPIVDRVFFAKDA